MSAAVPRFEEWVAAETIDRLSDALGDPDEVRLRRKDAYRSFLDLPLEPNPLYRKYGYAAGVDLAGITPIVQGEPLSVPPALPASISVVHDASGTRATVPSSLADAGVRLEVYPHDLARDPASLATFLSTGAAPADRLAALSSALVNRGFQLTIPKGVHAQVHDLTVMSAPQEALSVRRVVNVGEGAQLILVEEVYSTGTVPDRQRWGSSHLEISLESLSRAAVVSVHAPDPQTVSFYSRSGSVGADAHLGWLWAGFGGYRTKVRNSSTLVGRGSDLLDLQSFYGDGDQSYDSAIDMTHVGSDTHGQSITRGVFKDRARGMSRGLVRIEKSAPKTISYLSEHAMLLSRGARSDTIPILEILNRDVKATHSTSVAPVDPEKIFYLESRGLTESDSIRMIGEGFLSHVLDRAPTAALRYLLAPLLSHRWDGDTVPLGTPDVPLLPELSFAGPGAETDWRFDAKLR